MSSTPAISVIMRTRNSSCVVGQALEGLFSQQYRDFDLIVIDSGSTDRTREIVLEYPCRLAQIEASDYVPGSVLNMAVRMARADRLVFQNSDVVPLHGDVLGRLLAPLDDPGVAASFARQVPRPEAAPWVRRDYAAAFPGRGPTPPWMALSLPMAAMRRDVWEQHPFYEDAWASEDTEWGIWARAHGWRVAYVPEAVVMHSHNYTLQQLYGRRFVEGEADAFIHDQRPDPVGALARVVRSCLSDTAHHVRAGELTSIPSIPLRRAVFHLGHEVGVLHGARRRARGDRDIGRGQRTVLAHYDDGQRLG